MLVDIGYQRIRYLTLGHLLKAGSEATSVSQYHMIVQGLGLAAEVLELRLRLVASARFTCVDR